MATIIKLKRGTTTPTTSDLANGEVGIDTSSQKFYINDSGTIKQIIGNEVEAAALGGDVRSYTGDGSTTAFTVSSGSDVENVLVFVNGVYQRPTTDYTVSGTTLTFGTAPANADAITIKELVEGLNSLFFADDSSTTTELRAGSTLKISGDTGITSTLSNDILSIDLDDTAVTPGSYGSTSSIPTFIVDQQGRLTAAGSVSLVSSITFADESSSIAEINTGETFKITGGSGITTVISGDTLSINLDSNVVTETSTNTLTNKTIDADNNTITNIGDSELSSGISATKIADGSITNTEFQHLNGVSSNIQTQLDSKASTAVVSALAIAL